MKIRLFTALLAAIMLLSSCALNSAKDIPDVTTSDVISEETSGVEDEETVTENETADVSRPDIGISVESPTETTKEPEIAETTGLTSNDVFVPYDVPLTVDQQKLVEKIGKRFGVDEELIFAVMYVETRYNVNAVGKNKQYLGIMQISKSNFNNLNRRLGITDLMDFEQNVISGTYFLDVYLTRLNGDKHKSLIYYHGGWKYGDRLMREGTYEDSYSRKVISEMERIVEKRRATAASMNVTLLDAIYNS